MGKIFALAGFILISASSASLAQPRIATVAIYEMRDNTRSETNAQQPQQSGYNRRYSQSYRQPSQPVVPTASRLSVTIQDMLAQAIVSTNKFRVVERSQLRVLLNEQAKARSGLITSDTPGQIGGFEGADYLIYGSINQASSDRRTHALSAKNSGSGAAILGRLLGAQSSQAQQAPQSCTYDLTTISINIKIVDARSGEVRYSAPVDQSGITYTNCPGLSASTITDVFRLSARVLAFNLVTAIYPMQVASILPSRELIVNYGQGFLGLQDLLTVYSKGAEIRDPATGERIGNDETLIGLAEVSEVNAKFSKATPIYGFGTPAAIGSIVRVATEQQRKEWEQIKAKARAEAEAANKRRR